MESLSTDVQALRATAALMKAIAHKIRTPLSVVSNELSCLEMQLPECDLSRSRKKISEISRLLKSCQEVGRKPLTVNRHPLNELFDRIGLNSADNLNISDELWGVKIECDLERIRFAFKMIHHILNSYGAVNFSSVRTVNISVVQENELRGPIVSFSAPVNLSKDLTGSDEFMIESDSLTGFFSETLNWDSPYPPLIDCVLWAHRWQTAVRGGVDIEINVMLPVSNSEA